MNTLNPHCVGHVTRRRRAGTFGLAALLGLSGLAWTADEAAAQQAIGGPRTVVTGDSPIDESKPLDPRISALPGIQGELQVIAGRSQLVRTSSRIDRLAVSDPSIIEVVAYNKTELSLIGQSIGSTTLTVWFEDDDNPMIYLLKVIRDPSLDEQRRLDYGKLERKLALIFPNSKVYLIPLSGKILVKGQARDSQEASRIMEVIRGEVLSRDGSLFGPGAGGGLGAGDVGVNDPNRALDGAGGFGLGSSFIVDMLTVPGEHQVMLRVRVAELNRSQLRRMGVDLTYLINDGRHVVSSFLSSGSSVISGIFENGEATVLVDALASNGSAQILTEPTLTCLSGTTATLLSGGQFAVPQIVGLGGAAGQQTNFRSYGTSLVVTPTVVDRDKIRMVISPEFSGLNGSQTQGIPGLDTRSVSTTVELREGQTIVLGGLLSRQRNTEITRVPLLGEIPVIGPVLFNGKQSTEDETELLVLVSPELVRAMEPDEVPPVPGFYVTHPTDHELYKYAKLEGAPNTGVYQLAPYGNYHGHGENVGFHVHNPAPASPQYSPVPTANGGMMQPGMMQPGLTQPGMMQPGMMQPGYPQGGNMQPVPDAAMYPTSGRPMGAQGGNAPLAAQGGRGPSVQPASYGRPAGQNGARPGGHILPGGQR